MAVSPTRLPEGLRGAAHPGVFATPRKVTDPAECFFYHAMDVPGFGFMPADWDLRAGVDDYLGGVDFQGKRVLELGTASGFVCFTMERRGADVVAFDLAPDGLWDFVPMARLTTAAKYMEDGLAFFKKLHNSFWLGHAAFGSRARVVYGSIYDLPAEIGLVDIATFGCILLHLRDPFLALANALRFTRETVVITQPLHGLPSEPYVMGQAVPRRGPAVPLVSEGPPVGGTWFGRKAKKVVKRLLGYKPPAAPVPALPAEMVPCMVFIPDYRVCERMDSWWFFTPAVLQQFIGALGFEDSRLTYHHQPYQGQPHAMYTVVGRRTQPMPRRIDGPFPWF
jgi:hypothetical protein